MGFIVLSWNTETFGFSLAGHLCELILKEAGVWEVCEMSSAPDCVFCHDREVLSVGFYQLALMSSPCDH